MAYHQVTAASLTPSRPAPQAPQRGGTENEPGYMTNTSLASSGYNSSITLMPASPSGSSYIFPYSGIGGSPNHKPDDTVNSQVVRHGAVSMKEDSFGNWLFLRKWLVLKEQTLSVHKSEVVKELYGWLDDVYSRSSLMGIISNPTNFVHRVHVAFDPISCVFTGMPKQWSKLLTKSAITREDYAKIPQAVPDVLQFYTDHQKRELEDMSLAMAGIVWNK